MIVLSLAGVRALLKQVDGVVCCGDNNFVIPFLCALVSVKEGRGYVYICDLILFRVLDKVEIKAPKEGSCVLFHGGLLWFVPLETDIPDVYLSRFRCSKEWEEDYVTYMDGLFLDAGTVSQMRNEFREGEEGSSDRSWFFINARDTKVKKAVGQYRYWGRHSGYSLLPCQ